MLLDQALKIVLELAEQNALSPDAAEEMGVPEEREAQQSALKTVMAFATALISQSTDTMATPTQVALTIDGQPLHKFPGLKYETFDPQLSEAGQAHLEKIAAEIGPRVSTLKADVKAALQKERDRIAKYDERGIQSDVWSLCVEFIKRMNQGDVDLEITPTPPARIRL